MSTSTTIRAWAAQEATRPVTPFSYDPGPLGAEEVEIRVEHCGLCHSDLSISTTSGAFRAIRWSVGTR